MAMRNVTLALDEDTLRELKIIAARKGTSMSALMRERIDDLVCREGRFVRARERALERMHRGYDLGTYGKISWTRDEIYDEQ